MPKFLNDISLEQANDLQFKTAAGANAGKIEQDGNNLVLTNPVGDIMIGDGAADVYIGDGINNVDILFEQSGSIKAEDGTSGVTLTLGSSDTTLALGSYISSTLTVGVNDAGYDVIFYGATSGKKMQWDESADTLIVDGTLDVNGNADIAGNLSLSGDNRILNLAGGTTSSQSKVIIGEQGNYGVAFRWDSSSELDFDGFWATDVTGSRNRDLGKVNVNSRLWTFNEHVVVGGELEALSLDINGNADISGTLSGNFVVRSTNNSNTDGANFAVDTTNKSTSEYAYEVLRSGTTVAGITMVGKITGTELEGTSLDINGAADISGTLVGAGATFSSDVGITGTGNLTIRNTSGSGSGIIFLDTTWQGGIEHSAGSLFFRTGGQTDRMVLRSNGNLLLGTTTDDGSNKLQVSGSITASGEIEGGSLDINGNADISGALTLGTVLAATEGGTGLSSISTLLNSNVTLSSLGAQAAGSYLTTSGKAADSEKLDGLDSTEYGKVTPVGEWESFTDPLTDTSGFIDSSWTNKFEFFDTSNILVETSTDDSTYTTTTEYSDAQLKNLMGGDGNAGISIPNLGTTGTAYKRFTFTSANYVSLSLLYEYVTRVTGTLEMKVEKRQVNTWTTVKDYTNVGGWPAHVTLRHGTIWFNPSTTSTGHYWQVRVTIKGTTTNSSYINHTINKLQWWGGYPSGRRNLFSTDSTKNATFPGTVAATNLSGTNTGDQDLSSYITQTNADARYVLETGGSSSAMTGDLHIIAGSPKIILQDNTDDDDHQIVFRNNGNGDDYKITTGDFTSAGTGDGLFIGSESGDPVKLVTNDTIALTIDTSQNATFAGDVSVGDDLNIAGDQLTFTNDAASAYIRGADSLIIESDFDNDDSGSKPIYFYTNGTEMARMEATVATFAGEVEATTLDINGQANIGGDIILDAGGNSTSAGIGNSGNYLHFQAKSGDTSKPQFWMGNHSDTGVYTNASQHYWRQIDSTNIATLSAGQFTVTGEIEATSLDINGNADISGTLDLGGDLKLDLGDNIRFGGQLAITKENNGELKFYGGTNSTDGGFEWFTWDGSAYVSALTLKNNQTAAFAGNVTIAGNLTTEGEFIINTTSNVSIKDTIITLNDGVTTSDTRDIGIMFERVGNNKFIGWDESESYFILAENTQDVSVAVTGLTMGTLQTLRANVHVDTLSVGSENPAQINAILDQDNMASNSATSLATQQSIKAYADTMLPKAGGTMSGAIAMGNNNITGVNILEFNDPGPGEGLQWNGGNIKLYESPDDLTTNTAGNLQFVYGSTRRLTVNNTGIDVNGTATFAGDITVDKIISSTYSSNAFLDFDYDETASINNTTLASIARINYIADTNGNDGATAVAHAFMTGTTDIDTATSLLTILNNGNATFGGNVTAPNLIASTAVYAGGAIYAGGNTLSLKKSDGNSYVDFDTNLNATFAGNIITPSLTLGANSTISATQTTDDSLYLQSAGTGVVRVNYTGGLGGFEVYTGNNQTMQLQANSSGITIPEYIIHAGDANTKFGFSGADTFLVQAGGGDKLKVETSGTVLLSDGGNADGSVLYLKHQNNNTTDTIGTIFFGNNADSTLSAIVTETNGANNTSNLKFRTSNAGTIGTALTLNADNSATFAGNVDIYTGAGDAEFNIGRNSNERLQIYQNDLNTILTADNDDDTNGTHNFILNRTFGGTGANNFVVQKDGTAQLTIDTNADATFAGDIYVGAGKMGRDADNLLDFSSDNLIYFRLGAGNEFLMANNMFGPAASDGAALGNSTYKWSDLFLASGAVINFDNGNVTLTHSSNALTLADNDKFELGTGGDLQLYHTGTGSIIQNAVGNLTIQQDQNDGDIIFRCDDGLNGTAEYFKLDGASVRTTFFKEARFDDNVNAKFGTSGDLKIYHDGSNSYIDNSNGIFRITQSVVDGDLVLRADNGSGSPTPYLTLDGSSTTIEVAKQMNFNDHVKFIDNAHLYLGSANDLSIDHNGTNSLITNNTGDLYIENNTTDGDIIFKSDDSSGSGTMEYFRVDGGIEYTVFSRHVRFIDSMKVMLGNSNDLQIYHDGNNSYISNIKDNSYILFQNDDGAGGLATYFVLDGNAATHDGSATTALYTNWPDLSRISLGSSHDLQIYHDGSNSFMVDAGTGDMLHYYSNDWKVIKYGTGELSIWATTDAGVKLYYDNSLKLETVSGGVNVTGAMTATADVVAYSDKKLKENIKTLDGKKVLDMRGVSFTRKDTNEESSGVIAQEIQKVAPELVHDNEGTLGVAYGNLVGYLIEAVKDQQKQIDELKAIINGNSK